MLFNKKFDLILSIGRDCACSSYLRRFNLQDFSYPFDWLTKASFKTRIDLLVNGFDGFLNKDNIIPLEKPQDPNVTVDKSHAYYQDKLLDFYFYHDFREGRDFDSEYSTVKNKYDRRINRLYDEINQSRDILFVWWGRDEHVEVVELENAYNQLKDKFIDKNIYLLIVEFSETPKDTYLCDGHVLLTQFDTLSFAHNPAWNLTMGNEANNMALFAQIKRARPFSWYPRMLVYKSVKLLLGLMPTKELRHHLKDEWTYLFFRNKL